MWKEQNTNFQSKLVGSYEVINYTDHHVYTLEYIDQTIMQNKFRLKLVTSLQVKH